MAGSRFALVRGRALRATRLDGCGGVVLGPSSSLATDGFISVAMTPNNTTGEPITVTNANGDNCVLDEPSPRFQSMGVEVAFCGVDPELFNMLTGQPLVLNADGTEAVGFRINSKIELDKSGFALELWSKVPQAACSASGDPESGYLLLPFVQGGTLGGITVANASVDFTLTGAVTKDGNQWGVGPYDVTRDESGIAGPLNEALDPNDHFHMERVSVAPPTVSSNGASELGTEATGATAGSPGSPTPANSYFPQELADMDSVTADPTTAWTSGQYVIIGDGSSAHWNGAAWVAGVAP